MKLLDILNAAVLEIWIKVHTLDISFSVYCSCLQKGSKCDRANLWLRWLGVVPDHRADILSFLQRLSRVQTTLTWLTHYFNVSVSEIYLINKYM